MVGLEGSPGGELGTYLKEKTMQDTAEWRYVVTYITYPKASAQNAPGKETIYKLTAFAVDHSSALIKAKLALEALGYTVYANRKAFENSKSLRSTFLFQVEEA